MTTHTVELSAETAKKTLEILSGGLEENQDFEDRTISPIQVKNASISPYEIDRLISSGLSGKDICLVLAIKASYGTLKANIHKESFCEQWGFKEEDFDLAIARINKKKIISVPTETIVQLELFPEDE